MTEQTNLLILDRLDDEIRHKWLEFWSSNRTSSWRQHPAFGDVARSCNEIPLYAIGFDRGEIKFAGIFCLTPILGDRCSLEAVCLRGPIFDDISYAKLWLPQLRSAFQHRLVGSVRIGPYWRFPEASALERFLFEIEFQPYERDHALGRRTTGIIDIRPSASDILKTFKQSTRYEIKHAEKLGVKLQIADSIHAAREFFQCLEIRDKERGIGVTSEKESLAIWSAFSLNKSAGAVLCAYQGEFFLGGLLIARGGSTAFTAKFVVSAHCKQLHPTLRIAAPLFYSGMLWAKSHGCELIDLEGYSTINSQEGDKAFVNRYKAGFRPTECTTLGQYSIICNNFVYSAHRFVLFCQKASRFPMRLSHRIKFMLTQHKINRPNGKLRSNNNQ